jgi:hypothetical protein
MIDGLTDGLSAWICDFLIGSLTSYYLSVISESEVLPEKLHHVTRQFSPFLAFRLTLSARLRICRSERGWCSSVKRLATCWTFRGSNPGRGKRFSFPDNRSERLWGPPSLLFNWYRGSFLGVTRPERKADHSLPSGAEVRNEGSYKATPPTCLHGVDRD